MRILASLPDRLLVGLLGLVVVVCLALLLRVFTPWVVLPVGAVAILLMQRWSPPGARDDPVAVVCSVAAVLFAVGWVVLQWRQTGQAIGVGRDPSQYTNSALYLMHHSARDVAIDPDVVDLVGRVPALVSDFNYGGVSPADINYIQGNGLLPGLLAVMGWFGGTSAVFGGTTVLGGLGLIGVYAGGRRLLGPVVALGPVLLLGVTMPLAEFSRTPYTETVSLAFFGGLLAVAHEAVSRRRTDQALLAGAFAGAPMIARIDGGLTTVAFLAGMAGLLLFCGRGRDGWARRAFVWAVVGAFAMGLLGYAELRRNSPPYLSDLAGQFYPVVVLALVVVVVGLAATYRRLDDLRDWLRRRRRPVAAVVTVAVAVAAAVLLSRPWWMVNHQLAGTEGYVTAVAARQKAEGLPVDGTRSYDEYTLNWMAWYFTWPVLGAGLAGAVWAMWDGLRRRSAAQLVCWAIPGLVAVVYLQAVSITPDQIWAFRRLLPVVAPGMLLGAGYLFRRLLRLGMRAAVDGPTRLLGRSTAGVVGVLIVVVSATTWDGMYGAREAVGSWTAVSRLCGVGADDLILLAGPNSDMGTLLPAVQEGCDRKAVSLSSGDPKKLAPVAAAWTGGQIVVVVTARSAATWTKTPVHPLVALTYQSWESTLSHKPGTQISHHLQLWVGTLGADGRLTPIS